MKNSLLFAAFALVGLLGCQQDKPQCEGKNPVMLMDTFVQSGIGIDEFLERYRYLNTTEIQNSDLPAKDGCEPFSVGTITAIYQHHGQDGKLVLRFFNNQLANLVFYPKDSSGYFEQFCQKSKLCLKPNEEQFSNGTLIRRGNQADTSAYMSWEDHCLMQKIEAHLKKCS